MNWDAASARGRLARLGIVPAILAASLLAIVVAVVVVQAWTLHSVSLFEEGAAQRQLDINIAVLKGELSRRGVDWRLDNDGKLTVNGKVAEGLNEAVQDVARMTRAVATVFAGDTRVATTVTRADGSPATGTKLAAGPARDAVIDRKSSYRGTADILGVQHFTVYEPLRDPEGNPVGILFVGVPSANVQAVLGTIMRQTSAAALIVVLFVGVGIWLMLRATFRPLKALAGAVRTISDGRLEVSVPCADRTDQLGEIGRAVEMLREKAQQARILETQAGEERQAKDRRQKAVDQLTQDFGSSVSGVLAGLVSSAESMRRSAGEMAGAADLTSRDMASTTSDAGSASQNLSRVAAAADELTASVSEISRQVDHAARAAREAVDQARATDTTVHGLSQAAGQIGEVVSLISSIAAQTNLLALNATIEAARAGEAGRGFAVVAGEVKQLAGQTAEATKRIGLQVSAIQTAAGQAANAVNGVTAAIGRVSEVAAMIAAAVEQQGSATHEIAVQVNAVATAIDAATRAMLSVQDTAEKSGQTSQTVLVSADELTQISSTLRAEVGHFMTAMLTSQQTDNRRRYERIAGGGVMISVRCGAQGTASTEIKDISLGGAGLACDWPCRIGMEVMLLLPGGGPEVPSRVVRARDGLLVVAFRQDPETLGRVAQAVDWVAARSAQAGHSLAA